MRIIILAHFCDDLVSGNNRFSYLATALAERGNDVELITSSFSHAKKEKKNKESIELPYKPTFIEEPPYKKNISIKRLLSHRSFAKNISQYLQSIDKPDVIYAAIPSLGIAKVAADYCKKNGVRFIVDVQDLWPEAFMMVFNPPLIGKLVYKPFINSANYIYKVADDIVAVSNTFLARATSVNNKVQNGLCVFLGTSLSEFDSFSHKGKRSEKPDEIWLCYLGSLSFSYNIDGVIKAIKDLENRGRSNIRLLVIGDGPRRKEFEELSNELAIKTNFTGFLPYSEAVNLLTSSDIAVNPINGDAASIINKHGDYAAAGLPVINTQKSKEYRDLLEKYHAGISCSENDNSDLADKIELLASNEALRIEMGNNSRKLAEDKFNRDLTYCEIFDLIEKNTN